MRSCSAAVENQNLMYFTRLFFGLHQGNNWRWGREWGWKSLIAEGVGETPRHQIRLWQGQSYMFVVESAVVERVEGVVWSWIWERKRVWRSSATGEAGAASHHWIQHQLGSSQLLAAEFSSSVVVGSQEMRLLHGFVEGQKCWKYALEAIID